MIVAVSMESGGLTGGKAHLRTIAHISGTVSVLILFFMVCSTSLGGRYWGMLHSGSQTGFLAWMFLGLSFALIATFAGSRWWLISVVFVLASMYLLYPVVFGCPVLRH